MAGHARYQLTEHVKKEYIFTKQKLLWVIHKQQCNHVIEPKQGAENWKMNQTIINRNLLDLHARLAPTIAKIVFSTSAARLETGNVSLRLKPLQIKPKHKVVKHETFIERSIFGEVDSFYLKFPRLVRSVEDVQHLKQQYSDVCHNFSRLSNDLVKLKESGLLNLNSFSSVELVHLFEAIGSSLNYRDKYTKSFGEEGDSSTNLVDISNQITVTSQFLARYQEKKTFLNATLPLVIHNSLILSALQESTNSKVQELCLSNLDQLKIAFAFCEPDDNFASVPYPYWNSNAVYDKQTHTWTLNGNKSRILKDDYDYYLVHCKTVNNGGKKVSDFGIVTFLVDKDRVQIEDDGSDNYGNKYVRIVFNNLCVSSDEAELFPGTDTPTTVLNIKANGQLITSAIVLGILKEALRNIHHWYQSTSNFQYKALAEDRLAQVSEMIYSLESMLYWTASHLDSFELDKIDLHLEAMAIKVMASEFAAQTMDVYRLLFDSRRLGQMVANDTHDVLNILDSLLDSTTSNRLLLATYGIRTLGTWRFDHVAKMRLNHIYAKHFFGFRMFPMYSKKVYQRFDGSMDGHKELKMLHPSLKKSTKLLKKVLADLNVMGTLILETYGKEAITKQVDLNRFSSMIMCTFRMMAVIARANHSLNHNMPNSVEEGLLCQKICARDKREVENLRDLIYGVLEMSEEKRSATIHRRNIRFDGYFARPTFDRII